MKCERFFEELWRDFTRLAPHAASIAESLSQLGERVVNDHVAFRTFNRGPYSLEALEPILLGLGYRPMDEYRFEAKRLRARAYLRAGQPRIFLSELLVEQLGSWAQSAIDGLLSQIPAAPLGPERLWSGRPWRAPSFADYARLSEESEYAGWLAAHGLHANHFTVSINALETLRSVEQVLSFVESLGFSINEAGGRVKGKPEDLLEQGSTLADSIEVAFAEGPRTVPSCYYEFALRHEVAPGQLYEGFVPASADKIFESTDRKR